ncbi:PREDICTED: nose resistant to fluoxetine protein 6-like isoform X2 [Dinoponera quadriceps]|uniref:Nose resistant to fluoxetine protein 6-like isoform X2 n=1 Tax=Dinoponera quadriceps TaxID=609295 RepID=A0A6P3WSD6_DINQU|nr:PREDICTED: nose resistant to fluoxetine protein 6-like isoform X2 [Dinoponera quadriceps]
MRGAMRLPFVALLVLSSIHAEEVSTDTPGGAAPEESNLRVRSLPAINNVVEKNWTSLSETLDIFSARNLARNWAENGYTVGEQCGKDITTYVGALKNQELWALKVDDASGRFTNGFFWGNSYFTGSATECDYIGQDYLQRNSESSVEEVREFNTEPRKRINTGSSGAGLLETLTFDDKPPYRLGFYMIRLSLNASRYTSTRVIHLGVCLPFSCTASDVAVIGKLAASDFVMKHSTVEKVRDQHNLYDMYADPVFWILFGVSATVLVIMIFGTGYDYYLTKKFAQVRSNVIYDLEKHGKLDRLANGNQKVLNVADSSTNGVQPNNNNDHESGLQTSTTEAHQLNVCQELLLSFSVRANVNTICDRNVGGDTISTIHGLRAISMAWVILGHTCIVVFKYSDNMEYRRVVEKRFLFQTITNGAFSVDTFFFMGGLLVSFLYFRTNAKGDLKRLTQGTRGFVAGTLKFIGLLLYRFSRLTAPYMFVLGVVEISMKYFHANSVFEPPTPDHYNCPNYWWRNLLYINTWFPVEQMCMLWSWYVADDTQFYIVGGVILVLATNHFKIAAFALVSLLVSSWLTTGYIALVNNHMPSSDDPLALFDKIYDKPWTRLGPYLIGMSVGYFLFKTDCKVRMSKTTVVVGWLLSSACLLSLLYGLYETELTPATAAAYSSLSHSAWALGLAWIVVACSTGYGGYVNRILSEPLLYPFSRVTYCAYLVHPLVIRLTAMNLDSPFHLGKDLVLITFLGQLVLSYALSFVISISFEAPVVSMLKILSPKKRKRIQ